MKYQLLISFTIVTLGLQASLLVTDSYAARFGISQYTCSAEGDSRHLIEVKSGAPANLQSIIQKTKRKIKQLKLKLKHQRARQKKSTQKKIRLLRQAITNFKQCTGSVRLESSSSSTSSNSSLFSVSSSVPSSQASSSQRQNSSSRSSHSSSSSTSSMSSVQSTSSASSCNDGLLLPPEQCDGSNLNGMSCTTLGFQSGQLTCNANCQFDTSNCQASNVTLWVDPQIAQDCSTYSAQTRSCNGNNGRAYRNFQTAADVVLPGETIMVRAGEYKQTITLWRNGFQNARITVKSYPGDHPAVATINAERVRTSGLRIMPANSSGTCSGGNYTTVEGFIIKNAVSGNEGNVRILGSEGAILRNLTIMNDNWIGEDYAPGIHFSGPARNLTIEDNNIYYTKTGIEGRWSDRGRCAGEPDGTLIRGNHVHHITVNDPLQQNHSFCISVSNGVKNSIIENNLAHHCSDFAIGTNETFGKTIIRRNIVYGADYGNGGGGGNGIKIKPLTNTDSIQRFYRDEIYYNITLLNRGEGIHLIQYPNQWGADVLNNTAVLNNEGITFFPRSGSAEFAYVVMNNVAAFNSNRDIPIDVASTAPPAEYYDYNFLRIRRYSPLNGREPHSQAGTLSLPLDPVFSRLEVLVEDLDTEGTPLYLQALSATPQRPAPNGFVGFPNTRFALSYARGMLAVAVSPRNGSPLIDAGRDFSLGDQDSLLNPISDNPAVIDPWPLDPFLGYTDIGAIEYQP